jgi:succinoglycan biosynthesis protein ExoA
MIKNDSPTVSVIIPAWNEKDYIEHVIYRFQNSTYQNIIEIIVGDGGSTDGTQDIVRTLMQSDERIKLIDNPKRIQSAALNLMIDIAKGEVIVRADAHCIYSENYVESCIETLKRTSSVCVGGAQRFVATNNVQAGISLAVRSLVGSGNAKYRDEKYNGYADTVFLGCFLKSALEKTGGFRTDVGVNEDTEMNIRILKSFPNGIYISSDIEVYYFPRSSLKLLWTQYYRYGISRVKTRRLHKDMVQSRSSLPFFTLLFLIVGVLIETALFDSRAFVGVVIPLFLLIFILSSVKIVLSTARSFKTDIWRTDSKPPNVFTRFIYTFSSAITLNIAHAVGYGAHLFFKKEI